MPIAYHLGSPRTLGAQRGKQGGRVYLEMPIGCFMNIFNDLKAIHQSIGTEQQSACLAPFGIRGNLLNTDQYIS